MTNRRKFIAQTATLAGTMAAFKTLPGFASTTSAQSYTVQQVMDLIYKEGNITPSPGTVDTIKAGDASETVNGIVTTMFATVDVIKQAAKLNANFIVAHEPTFYNHLDDKTQVSNNPVVKEKLDLLSRHKITVWRFHDGLHSMTPDPVDYGFLEKTGWTKYFKNGLLAFEIPPVSLQQLVAHLKSSLGIPHVRVVGDVAHSCKRLAIIPGAAGVRTHIQSYIDYNPDVIIVGEISEWETAEFMRDSNLLGHKKSLVVLGHAFSEEPGMVYLTKWLQPKLPGVKITHIASGEPYTWM